MAQSDGTRLAEADGKLTGSAVIAPLPNNYKAGVPITREGGVRLTA